MKDYTELVVEGHTDSCHSRVEANNPTVQPVEFILAGRMLESGGENAGTVLLNEGLYRTCC